MFSVITVYGILVIILTLRYMFYHLHSTLYVLPATLFDQRSMLYNLPSKSIYTLLSKFYKLLALQSAICHLPSTLSAQLHSTLYVLTATLCDLRSMLYDLPSKPICLKGYHSFFIFFIFFNRD